MEINDTSFATPHNFNVKSSPMIEQRQNYRFETQTAVSVVCWGQRNNAGCNCTVAHSSENHV
jgi:hypothetical protein